MKGSLRLLAILLLLLCSGGSLLQAQSDKEVKAKQNNLKQAAHENLNSNQIINKTAEDKPAPSASAFGDVENKTTGYDFTQVKGFNLANKADHDRIDELFRRAYDLGLIDREYIKNGSFNVPGSAKPGTAQIRRVEVYYVRTTKGERENLNTGDFELLELRVEKQLNLPEKDEGGGEDEEEVGRRRRSRTRTVVNPYKLAGSDLLTAIGIIDESLRQDLVARRGQEPALALPPDLATDYTKKRGPFVVQGERQLDVMKGVFRSFWSKQDSVIHMLIPATAAAGGPLSESDNPVLLPVNKISVRNQGNDPLKVTGAMFVGENADKFAVTTKLPVVIDKAKSVDIEIKYTGESQYETIGLLEIQAKDANLVQDFDVFANPGIHPIDIAVLDASLFGVELRSPARASFAPNWNVGLRFGNDELNMPRWASGMGEVYVGFKNDVHVGLVLPVNMQDGALPSPLGFNTGLLTSPMGYAFDFDFSFGFPFSLGGNLLVTDKFDAAEKYSHVNVLRNVRADDKDYNNDFFNISTAAKIYYPVMFKSSENDPGLTFRLELGGGYINVNRNHIVLPGETSKEGISFGTKNVGRMFSLGKEKDVFDVYFRFSFINLGSKNNYGIGLQYFNGGMMTDAWLELTNWLRVEMKYAFLLRTREIWESETSYFMISPRFRFGFPSIFN